MNNIGIAKIKALLQVVKSLEGKEVFGQYEKQLQLLTGQTVALTVPGL